MNQIITTTTDLGQCDMQALETATAIVHLNAPETVTVTAAAAETVPTTTTSSKLAACDVCGKVFSCYNLERHKRTHRGEKLFSCMVCNRSFSQKSHLTVHERIHTGERPFKCNICGCAFSRKDYLVRHTWTQHSGKVYTINNQTVTPIIHPAKKQRTRKSKMVNVTLTSAVPVTQLATNSTYSPQQEADQPPLPQLPAVPPPPPTTAAAEEVVVVPQEPTSVHVACKECLKEYTQSQQQQQQQQQLQQQSSMNFTKSNYEELPLSCLYVCEVCGKSFQTASKLSTHCKIHTRPKSFVCDVCQKAFSRRDHLNVHKQIHTGKRPHKCDVCGYAFTRIDHLMRHKRPNKGMRKLSCVPRVLTDMPATDESPPTATVEDDSNTAQAVVSAAVAATSTLPTAVVVPSHHADSMTQNGQATTITTLTNVPHHVTVQPLYHANISQQLTVPFNPQQLDVATVQIYTTTK